MYVHGKLGSITAILKLFSVCAHTGHDKEVSADRRHSYYIDMTNASVVRFTLGEAFEHLPYKLDW